MVLQLGRSKVAILQIAIASTLPFLPAISEDFVFDDLPAIARNNDLVAASPTPIFLVLELWRQIFKRLNSRLLFIVQGAFFTFLHSNAVADVLGR